MGFSNKYGFNVEWNFKTAGMFLLLLALPNVLGMVNISTGLGFSIHLFQIAIFLAAMAYGPFGGLISGGIGAIYSAIMMHNPYIILFNAMLVTLVAKSHVLLVVAGITGDPPFVQLKNLGNNLVRDPRRVDQ